MKRFLFFQIGFMLLLLFGHGAAVLAGDALLSWTPNADPNATGYNVYYGTASRTYGKPIDVGNRTDYTVTGLDPGTYYFAVTAYSAAAESDFSGEVSKTIPAPAPPPSAPPPSDPPPSGAPPPTGSVPPPPASGSNPPPASTGPDTPASSGFSGASSKSGRGCSMTLPGEGEPSGPGQGADLPLLAVLILFLWIRRNPGVS